MRHPNAIEWWQIPIVIGAAILILAVVLTGMALSWAIGWRPMEVKR